MPYLVFRTHDHLSQGINNSDGFTAGKFVHYPSRCEISPTEDEETYLLDATTHWNRLQKPSPFISTTSSLIWAIYMALQKAKAHNKPVHISVLDGRNTSRLTRVFSGSELIQQLKEGRSVKFNYCGNYEYLVSKAAIIGSFTIEDLLALAANDEDVREFLRIDQLARYANNKFPTKLSKVLGMLQPLALQERTVKAIATFSRLIDSRILWYNPITKDLVRIIVQNFKLYKLQTPEEEALLEEVLRVSLSEPSATIVGQFCGISVPNHLMLEEKHITPL